MPELVDILDAQGRLTGETMVRAEAHRNEAWHGVSLVWLINTHGDILLQRRAAHLNVFPEKWDVTVSGHMASGDVPLQTALREFREEIGIYVRDDEIRELGMVSDSFPLVYGKLHREVDHVFLIHQDIDIEHLRLQAAEIQEVCWVSPDELEADLGRPETARRYAVRDRKVYQFAIDAGRRQHQKAIGAAG